jgi:fumarate reductase subunit D
MKEKIIAIISSPVTHFNILVVGFFIFVGSMHNEYHHRMEHDIHGHVRRFCVKNPDTCQKFIDGDYY